MKKPELWLTRRLGRGEITGYKVGRHWRMTAQDVESLVESLRNIPNPGPHTDLGEYPGGLTRRAWQRRQRYPDGNPHGRRPRQSAEVVPPPKIRPLPSGFHVVHAEAPEVVAAMPGLTEKQVELLNQLRREGEVVVTGLKRKTVEALVKRGLVTYEVEYVLNEKHLYYFYRFTVRPTGGSQDT